MGKSSQRLRAKQKAAARPGDAETGDGRARDRDVAKSGECPGTFRWGPEKVFPQLPPAGPGVELDLSRGWMSYLSARGGQPLVAAAQQDGSLIDGLSFAATLIMAAQRFFLGELAKATPATGQRPKLNFVVIGAAARAEQRVARDTNYFDEVALAFAGVDVTLWLVGPEVSSKGVARKDAALHKNLFFRCHRGTVSSFFEEEQGSSGISMSTVDMFVGFNPGFGCFTESKNMDLLMSWLDDLYLLASSNVPCVFTCANDYGDVKGETLLLSKIIGANFAVTPRKNSFSMATTLLDEGVTPEMAEAGGRGWSCGNAYWYAIQGVDKQRARHIERGSHHSRSLAVAAALNVPDIAVESILAPNCTVDGPVSLRLKTAAAGASDASANSYTLRMSELDPDIVLSIPLPGVLSMVDVMLDVSSMMVRLSAMDRPEVLVNLPCAIDPDRTIAKFSKRSSELKLTLPKL